MPFLPINPNEKSYTGGRKHFKDVIKNTSPADYIAWKQPEEDFNNNSTLIVMPGEKAIFIKEGNIEQIFENGTYILTTQNYPFISRLRNTLTGGISSFNCVIIFTRDIDSVEFRWGTDTPIQLRDNFWKIHTEAKVRGSYKLRIYNAEIFVTKLFSANYINDGMKDISNYFASDFQSKIKSEVAKYLRSLQTELIGIEAYMNDISEIIKPIFNDIVKTYGLECVSFAISGLDIDTSKYDDMDEAQITVNKTKMLSNMNSNVTGIDMATSNETSQTNNSSQNLLDSLAILKKMLDSGLIEQDEYDKKKNEILAKL